MREGLDQTIEKAQEELGEKPGQSSRQIPVGIGGEQLKEGRETLPAIEVANEVSWVNKKLNSPFNFKVGEQSPLGMFLTPNPQNDEKTYNLEVSPSHTRSGVLGRVIFSDKEGHLYRDIDLKGMGFHTENKVMAVNPDENDRSRFSSYWGSSGIANQELIRRDIEFSEKFFKAGIRTHRAVALIDLKEILDQRGRRISVEEAKERGILKKNDEPVIEIRAYGTRSRLWDIIDALGYQSGFFGIEKTREPNKAKAIQLLLDAKNIVAQEQNINADDFTYDKYFKWLIEITAINMARMHFHKWVHGYTTAHNITLDGRIVDLDSVEKITKEGMGLNKGELGPKTFNNDIGSTVKYLFYSISIFKNELENLSEFLLKFNHQKDLNDFFEKVYDEELARLKTKRKIHKNLTS